MPDDEIQQILKILEKGAVLQHYVAKSRRFERKYVFVRADTNQLIWVPIPANSISRPNISGLVKDSLDISQIREIRKPQKVTATQTEGVTQNKSTACKLAALTTMKSVDENYTEMVPYMQVMYGNEFNLNKLSFLGRFSSFFYGDHLMTNLS